MNAIRRDGGIAPLPCFYETFIHQLASAGNELLVFYSWGLPYGERPATTKRIKDALKHFDPELVIAFNNFGPNYAEFVDCPIFIYEVDSPLYYDNLSHIKRHPDRYWYYVVQEESLKVLKEQYGVPNERIILTPFFTEVQAENLPKRTNISFIGSRFFGSEAPWQLFMRRNPVNELIRDYKDLVVELQENPFLSTEEIQARYPKLNVNHTLLDGLVMALSGEKRVGVLSAVADLGLEVYGPQAWFETSESVMLSLAYNPKQIYSLKDNQDLYNSSRICINVNHLQAISGFSWRVCDIMASTGCLVSEYRRNLEAFFPGIPIPTFTNKFEAREQCRRLLANDNLRKEISTMCRQIINERYRFRNVLHLLEQSSGLCLSASSSKGNVSFLTEDIYFCRHRASVAIQCLKLAACQVPGLGRLFDQVKCLRRIQKHVAKDF